MLKIKMTDNQKAFALLVWFMAAFGCAGNGDYEYAKHQEAKQIKHEAAKDAATVWPQREYVLQVMRKKYITKGGLATKTKLRLSLVSQVLAGERLPDNREREIILNAVENWGIKL